MPLPDEWYHNHLHLEDQKESAEEFLVDALYLTKVGTLLCKVANRTCFETRKAEDMKKHRETFHPALERRFPFAVWIETVPGECWNAEEVDGAEPLVEASSKIENCESLKIFPSWSWCRYSATAFSFKC